MGRSPKSRVPDIFLTAGARVEELRFERVPDTKTRFWGQKERETESGTRRENLPEEAQPNVVYRDVRIRLKTIAEVTGLGQSSGDMREENRPD